MRANTKLTIGRGPLDFLIQTAFSTVGAGLAAVSVVVAVAVLTALVTRNTSGGDFVDHLIEQPSFVLLNPPYFIAPVVAGFLLGLLSHRRFLSGTALWVWVVPACLLAWSAATWQSHGDSRAHWHDVWANYFSSQCSSSECLYEVFVTTPFYTSVTYSLGWLSGKLFRNDIGALK